ncbi:flippase [Halobaculum sp. P14]|uniref:flippase n=1 Tax=Halobaculum sp. P14 TaxID=3421638 RepID=UPI003EBA6D4A
MSAGTSRYVPMSRLDDSVRKLFKGGGILLAGLVLQLGISFVGKLIVARELSIADYGSVSLGTTVAATASTVALLGVHEGVGRFLPRYEDPADRRGVLVTAFSVAVPLSLLFGGALFVAAPTVARIAFDTPEVAPVFRVFAAVIPLMVLHQLVTSTIQGQQRTVPKVVIENISRPTVRIVAIAVVFLVVGGSAFRVSLAYLAGWIAPVLLGAAYLYRETSLTDRTVGAVLRHEELLRFSLPLLLSGMLSMVLNDLDTLLLGYFSGGTEQVALYNVVYPLAKLLMTAMTAFGFIFLPVISELHASGDHAGVNRMYQVVTKWIFVVSLPVFLVMTAFPSRLISLTFGAKYAGGGDVLAVLVVGFFVHTVAGMNRETASSIGMTRLLMYVDGGAAAVNTTLNLFLIPRYGPLGAAAATTATYAALNVALSTILYCEEGIVPVTMSMLRPGAAGVAAFVAVRLLVGAVLDPTPVVLVAAFGVFVVLYGVSVLRFGGIEDEEIMLVNSVEERFGVDLEPLKRMARRLMS